MVDHTGRASETWRDEASSNALSSVSKGKRFPRKVFAGRWASYLFFEPSVLFEEEFISIKDFLLQHNNDRAIALLNLGNRTELLNTSEVFIFESSTTWRDYLVRLVGDGSALNWMFLMDRYVCASNRGNWAIYCEKENDLAAFAVGDGFSSANLSRLARLLKGRSINQPVVPTDEDSFDFSRLVPTWKLILDSEYGKIK